MMLDGVRVRRCVPNDVHIAASPCVRLGIPMVLHFTHDYTYSNSTVDALDGQRRLECRDPTPSHSATRLRLSYLYSCPELYSTPVNRLPHLDLIASLVSRARPLIPAALFKPSHGSHAPSEHDGAARPLAARPARLDLADLLRVHRRGGGRPARRRGRDLAATHPDRLHVGGQRRELHTKRVVAHHAQPAAADGLAAEDGASDPLGRPLHVHRLVLPVLLQRVVVAAAEVAAALERRRVGQLLVRNGANQISISQLIPRENAKQNSISQATSPKSGPKKRCRKNDQKPMPVFIFLKAGSVLLTIKVGPRKIVQNVNVN